MGKSDFQKEAEYLDTVQEIIRHKLEKLYADKSSLRDRVLRERKDMWDENRHVVCDFDDVFLLSAQDAAVNFAEDQYVQNEMAIQRLGKMAKSPYFGRVDFQDGETGEEEAVYIGIYSLMENESHEIYVVDWRAPVASMFYQFDLGPAWYEVNDLKIDVEITGKKQYKIEEGRLLSVYDTASSMHDDILGEVLSNHSDRRLKVIIGSIQREQNAAIRSDIKRSCLIYGLAGSGKTSIGLHRLAYILYCAKNTIKTENILILSNNNIFGAYISTILPDLGEKAAETKVFADLLEWAMEEGVEIEDYYTQLRRIENWNYNERIKWLQVKYSPEMLQYCIDYFHSFSFRIPEVRYKEEVIVSPELLQGRLRTGKSFSFPTGLERLNHLIRKTIEDYFSLHRKEMEEEICDDTIESRGESLSAKEIGSLYKRTMLEYIKTAQDEAARLNRLDAKKQMTEIFSGYLRRMGEGQEEAERLSDSLERGKLWYEDALLYMFIKVLMGEIVPFTNIRHIVIDEAQDYNLIQLYIMRYLFPKSSFTLLGDIYQTINAVTTIQKYDDYERVFGPELIRIRLSKCYRSSADINALAFGLIGEAGHPVEQDYSYFERRVRKPQYIVSRDPFSCLAPILEQLEQYGSVAVIVNGEEEAFAVKSYLQPYREAQLIVSPEDEMKDRIIIIPLLLAKGLEFDAVILFNCIYANEKDPHMRRRVYLGCTRALHELYFIERDGLPDSLGECRQYIETKEWESVCTM
ncbi:MAG: UvrD-helicase domain-containing protein [Lachnospiraceae bacterium]|nr:UvrD-helicase domain-containing protein [Lachnospiraceae bacterium]